MYSRKKNPDGGECGKTKRLYSSMTENQKGLMLDFISSHPQMIRSRTVGGVSSQDRDMLWNELALVLNKCDSGAQKDGVGWRRSWNDMKRYESLKAAESMTRSRKCSVAGSCQTLQLSPLQDRIASLLGEVIAEEPVVKSNNSKRRKYDEPVQGSNCKNDDNTSLDLAKALQNITEALVERNMIEERKIKVYERFLRVFEVQSRLLFKVCPDDKKGKAS